MNKGRAIGTYKDILPSFVADASTPDRLSATWVGSRGSLKISSSTSFGVSDLFFTTTVTLENIGTSRLYEVEYMRNVDPDQEQVCGGVDAHDRRDGGGVSAL